MFAHKYVDKRALLIAKSRFISPTQSSHNSKDKRRSLIFWNFRKNAFLHTRVNKCFCFLLHMQALAFPLDDFEVTVLLIKRRWNYARDCSVRSWLSGRHVCRPPILCHPWWRECNPRFGSLKDDARSRSSCGPPAGKMAKLVFIKNKNNKQMIK